MMLDEFYEYLEHSQRKRILSQYGDTPAFKAQVLKAKRLINTYAESKFNIDADLVSAVAEWFAVVRVQLGERKAAEAKIPAPVKEHELPEYEKGRPDFILKRLYNLKCAISELSYCVQEELNESFAIDVHKRVLKYTRSNKPSPLDYSIGKHYDPIKYFLEGVDVTIERLEKQQNSGRKRSCYKYPRWHVIEIVHAYIVVIKSSNPRASCSSGKSSALYKFVCHMLPFFDGANPDKKGLSTEIQRSLDVQEDIDLPPDLSG